MPSVRLRDFSPEDAGQVDALALRAWDEYQAHYLDWDATKKTIGNMSTLAETGRIILAEIDQNICGAVAYMPPESPRADFFEMDWAIIRMLVVDPATRGHGIGRKLTDMCLSLAHQDKVQTIALHTNEMMKAALPMYVRMGFERVTTAPSPTSLDFGIYTLNLGSRG